MMMTRYRILFEIHDALKLNPKPVKKARSTIAQLHADEFDTYDESIAVDGMCFEDAARMAAVYAQARVRQHTEKLKCKIVSITLDD